MKFILILIGSLLFITTISALPSVPPGPNKKEKPKGSGMAKNNSPPVASGGGGGRGGTGKGKDRGGTGASAQSGKPGQQSINGW